jgi:YHS domain-containing protein
MHRVLVILVTGLFILGVRGLSFAQHEHSERYAAGVPAQETVNIGNKICPVSGEKIDEKIKATYEYEGKVYNFCCAMCIDEFKKGPQKYIKKVEEELQVPSKGPAGN